MIDREDAERMLRLAKVDLKAIRNMLDPEEFDDSVFGFHAQQPVEKALKAWLSLRGVLYPKTHDLRLLMNLLQNQAQQDIERFEHLMDFTDFAVQFRYDFAPVSAEINRRDALDDVETLILHCEGLVVSAETTG
jgi:HEPN domain-containing protein